MIITEDEARELKVWVVKKLEDISDADSDVLADYVLALIRADTSEPELRANAIENLEDFLKDSTAVFVDEILSVIHTKSYLPGYVPKQPDATGTPSNSTLAISPGPASFGLMGAKNGFGDGSNQSRKRTFNERQDDRGLDSHYGRGDRQMKQMRRNDMHNGRGGTFQRGPEKDFPVPATLPGLLASPAKDFPALPAPPPGMPFDPSDPMSAMLAMAAMGLPPLPGMPHTGPLTPGGQNLARQPTNGKNKSHARCRDYDTKGFCARGHACLFDHGHDQIVVPGQHEEYDPNNSVMVDMPRPRNVINGQSQPNLPRGSSQGWGPNHARSQRRNRAEFSQAGPNHDRSVTTVVVEQIPEENFEEQGVRSFFSEFGDIEEVKMQAYKRLAIVKFKDFQSAKRAYDSPKVIFDNRFVKVYWFNPNTVPTAPTNGTAVTTLSPTATSKPEEPAYDREKFERDALAAQKKLEERKVLQRKTELKRQELERQTEELERKRAVEKKKLEEKLRAKGLFPSASPPSPGSQDGVAAEGKAGSQTETLKATLASLEAETKSLGMDPAEPWSRGRGRGRGRGSYRGWEGFAGRGAGYEPSRGNYRGRGGFRGKGGGAYNLDNRTKTVKVDGVIFDDERDEALKQYLLSIGEYESIEPSVSKDAQIITFKDRFTAERLMFGSKDIPYVGLVGLSWVNTPAPPVPQSLFSNKRRDSDDTDMGGANTDGDAAEERDGGTGHHHRQEVDYDVAEEDERWMIT